MGQKKNTSLALLLQEIALKNLYSNIKNP